ncbi:MAG: response regulator [bacterium]|nr:response regulator [bacterium]
MDTTSPLDKSELRSAQRKGAILLVEDDEFLRSLVARSLGEAGYEVAIATDGEEAMMRIHEGIPDLILLDLVLPGYSGFEFIAKLRQEEATAKIPFLVLSNSAETENKKGSKDLGAVGYLVKAQSNPLEIVRTVDDYFAHQPAHGGEHSQA